MSYQDILEEVGRQSELKIEEAMQVLSAHEQAKRDTEKMMRETARIVSAHEQIRQDAVQIIHEIEQVLSAHAQVRQDAERMTLVFSRFMEGMRQQSKLKWFIVNQVWENESRGSAKSTTSNVSNYCREWDWGLYSLTDYYWYYCQQSLFDL